MAERIIFSGMQILLNQKWETQLAIVVEDSIIKSIIPEEMIKHHLPAQQHNFPQNDYLIPGLIDLHIHGVDGHDVMDGEEDSLQKMTKALAKEGVTGFLATTMTANNQRIEKALHAVANTIGKEEGAAILGVHLEGPFISPIKVGAQRREDIKLPNIELFRYFQEVAKQQIKLVTLAPELPDAIPFIKALCDMGIIVAAGHTEATYEQTLLAIETGCSHATHLFNAMRGIHQRDPGATGALLLSNHVMAELITDGIHLHPAITELALRMKNSRNLILVTDAIRAKCLGEGIYELGGQEILVTKNRATLLDGTLAGSTLHMPQAIKNMIEFSHCSIAEAIMMASFNPALQLKILDRKGTIEVGKDADLVVMSPEFLVKYTMREGKEIWRS